MHVLIRDNLSLLEQTREFARQVDVKHYATVGAHFRHLTDHYSLFLAHFHRGIIDYDQRERNSEIETSRDVLIMTIGQLMNALQVADVNPGSSIRVMCSTCSQWQAKGEFSTVGRELMFLHSHATHHLALIALKLEMTGMAVDPLIGMAPSTQRHYAGNLDAAG